MEREIWVWSASEAKAKLEKTTMSLPPLAGDEVEVKVKYCGVCRSDLHILEGDWGNVFPAICGHEMVGEITELGAEVTHLKKGQIVGVGWQRSSCGRCDYCMSQREQCCEQGESTCFGAIGGFAEYHRTKANFAIPIPNGFPLEYAGPLMCGGLTTFTPFLDFDIKPYQKVAVLGIGGLGHLALKWGVKWGCEMAAFSTSPDKEAEVKGFGVHHFIHYSKGSIVQREQATKFSKYFDFIMVTIPFETAITMLLDCLRNTGKICFLASGGGQLKIDPSSLFLGGQRSVFGSNTGSLRGAQIMLDFALRHKIYPMIEVMEMEKINEAIEKLRKGQVRYRLVLKA